MNRKTFIKSGILFLVGTFCVSNNENDLIDSTEWKLPDEIHLSQERTFDLKSTLPRSIHHGGRFSVNERIQKLPAGVSLTKNGILTVDQTVEEIVLKGIVFDYET